MIQTLKAVGELKGVLNEVPYLPAVSVKQRNNQDNKSRLDDASFNNDVLAAIASRLDPLTDLTNKHEGLLEILDSTSCSAATSATAQEEDLFLKHGNSGSSHPAKGLPSNLSEFSQFGFIATGICSELDSLREELKTLLYEKDLLQTELSRKYGL